MDTLRAFVAYPSNPPEIGRVLVATTEVLRTRHGLGDFHTWEENDVPGRFLVEPVLDAIEEAGLIVADVTRLNFNVVYEIGYAIGLKRRVALVRNSALTGDDDLIRNVGIFDTLGYERYENADSLATHLSGLKDLTPLRFNAQAVRRTAPLYVVLPKHRTDGEVRLVSRIKRARLKFRTFDPEEQGRMSAPDAIDSVAASHGVIVPLLANVRGDARVHNMRGAFVAGLAAGMGKHLLLLQAGYDPVPLDYRDLVKSYAALEHIDEFVADFASEVTEALQRADESAAPDRTDSLARLSLGASAAENELGELGQYYLETDEYRRAERGEVQVVAGRKGSGKTALFARLRDRLRRDRKTIVLDLKPEGFQLLKFKDLILKRLDEGAREHTVTAFWEYVLLLEICHKLLEKDREPHLKDHTLYEPYRALAHQYEQDEFVAEGDFAERMLKLTATIAEEFQVVHRGGEAPFDSARLTEMLYKHDVATLRELVQDYLAHKTALWVLFDNLDKGWPPKGIADQDVLLLRCLLDALAKLERSLRKRDIDCHGIVFIRNDVYELLVQAMPDRGKLARVNIDWRDEELLRALLQRRMARTWSHGDAPFEQLWRQICVTHISGEESSQYLVERCLMRPRNLIDLVHLCRSHAVNLKKTKMDAEDIKAGEAAYSTELVTNISLEIRDVYPEAEDVLYGFVEAPARLSQEELDALLRAQGLEVDQGLLEFLLWYGVLGVVRESDEVAYIYDVGYDMKRLQALVKKRPARSHTFVINPAFWAGLEVKA